MLTELGLVDLRWTRKSRQVVDLAADSWLRGQEPLKSGAPVKPMNYLEFSLAVSPDTPIDTPTIFGSDEQREFWDGTTLP